MSKVSVIIPAHNASAFIGGALDSVFSQGYDNLEVAVVNDGSTDDLEVVLKSYLKDGRIIYTVTENRGVSGALNTGLKMISGDYVAFLHADDRFLPGKIARQVASMKMYPRHDVSYTNENYFLEGSNNFVPSTYFHFGGDIFYFLKRNNFIHISTTMFKRSSLSGLRFDEALQCHEDWDLFLRLAANGAHFLYIDEILSSICMHQKSLSTNTQVMDVTRLEVGTRAKSLWKSLKRDDFMRYIRLKTQALLIGFPNNKKFKYKTPMEMLLKYAP